MNENKKTFLLIATLVGIFVTEMVVIFCIFSTAIILSILTMAQTKNVGMSTMVAAGTVIGGLGGKRLIRDTLSLWLLPGLLEEEKKSLGRKV